MNIGQHAPTSDVDAFGRTIADLERRIHALELRAGVTNAGLVVAFDQDGSSNFTGWDDTPAQIHSVQALFTARPGRLYQAFAKARVFTNNVGDTIRLRVVLESASVTNTKEAQTNVFSTARGNDVIALTEPTELAPSVLETATATPFVHRSFGSGSGTVAISNLNPAIVWVTDAGPV